MKTLIDVTSKPWFNRTSDNKVAAGFTVSGSLPVGRTFTLYQFAMLAAQPGLVWVGNDIPSGYCSSKRDFATAHDRAGRFPGLAMQALTDLPDQQTPDCYELKAAELFAKRVAQTVLGRARVPAQAELA